MFAAISVDAANGGKSIDPQFSGTNLAYWQYEMNTSKLQQMTSAAGLSLFRMPGGSGADEFHFTSPPPYNGYDTVPVMANFIQAAGGNAIVTVDYGSGSPQEAAAMLAYMNAPVGSTVAIGTGPTWDTTSGAWVQKDWKTAGYWAGLRAAAKLPTDDGLNFLRVGHAAPWAFSYYEIGNEEYATWETDHHDATGKGGQSPSTYIGFAKALSALAQQIDPNVKIGIDVTTPLQYNLPDANWTRDLLTQSVAQSFTPGFFSDHIYVTGLSDQNLLLHSVNDPNFKQDNFSTSWANRAAYYRNLLNTNLGTTTAAGVKLMLTEFNSDINTKQAANLVGALWTADALGGLAQTEYVAAVQWDLTNGYSALSTPDSTHYGWRQGVDMGLIGTGSGAPATGAYVPYPIYFAQQLFAKVDRVGSTVLPVVGSDPNLTTYAVKGADGHVRLLVINKSSTATISGTFIFNGFTPAATATQWRYGMAEDTAQSLTTDGHSSLTQSTITGVSGSTLTQSFPAYSMTVIDIAAVVTLPTAVASFNVNGPSVSFAFDRPVATATVDAADLQITNLTTGQTTTNAMSTFVSADAKTVTFFLPPTLPDGNYQFNLPAGTVAGTDGTVNSTDTILAGPSVFMLAGDVNHDRSVDFNDLVILAQNYGKTGQTFSQGNLDYLSDGSVDFNDLVILAQHYNTSLPAIAAITVGDSGVKHRAKAIAADVLR